MDLISSAKKKHAPPPRSFISKWPPIIQRAIDQAVKKYMAGTAGVSQAMIARSLQDELAKRKIHVNLGTIEYTLIRRRRELERQDARPVRKG